MTAVTLPRPSAMRITATERILLRAADDLAAHIHRRAMRRDARLLADLERERALADTRMRAMRAIAYDVPRLF
ncbi:hypothetical protein [Microbacterium stercoris]|uniref:Uncharacterized protein n=1 Tax=Microbacterium stercoris TaxID=2820289 RepID=A0A939QRA8_9MICO|nr:hypothetical protein [Microbacterium stercoris]MBO3664086.1 hypothetical protein [Microbacterium stercoris]